MRRSGSGKVSLREATSIIFALVAILPLLALLPVLWYSGVIATTQAQVSLFLALGLALLGLVILRRTVDQIASLARAVVGPETPAATAPGPGGVGVAVPGLGQVAEVGQLSGAFARMLEDLRGSTERLEDLVFKLSALNEVVELAARVPKMDELLDRVLERTMRTVRATAGSIMLVDRERQALRVVAARGTPGELVGAEVSLRGGIAGQIVQSGDPVIVDDIKADARFATAEAARYGSGAFIGMPIRVEDRTIGVITLGRSGTAAATGRPFSATDLQFLNALMAHVAYAVDNARLLQEAQTSTTRLRAALEELRTAQARVVEGETLRATGQMASGMAHHLNNLLSVASGRVQLLLRRATGTQPELREPLEMIHRATLDAAEVVRRVLGFTAIQPVMEAAPVDLNDVVRDVIELTRPRWRDEPQARGATIDTALDLTPIPKVRGEAVRLREALVNLMLNAIDALPTGGTIRIRTWALDHWVCCAVADDGVGMTEEVRRHAVEPFFTTKGPQGTGLGLSVVHGIIQRHRGEIEIAPGLGAGTVVTLRLPAEVTASVEPVAASVPPVPPLRILLVDDEAPVRAALADTFTDDGHTVLQVANGREALQRLEAGEQVDVVVTDLGMPEMNGWEVAREVKARWPGLPVGLVTGWAVTVEMSSEERAQTDFIIAKPYSLDALRSALATVHAKIAR